MPADRDHYQAYYSGKLWNLLPAIYRTLDTPTFNAVGPLRELVNRIGVQAAILRRSIDRLWEDQSIESCDDWVIPYIGALVATNLVASLDARGQRLDVAKTIYYRRRKGTVAVLEEIAADITGWDAKIVEFFRRLGRTRHNFDPPIAEPGSTPSDDLTLQLAEGLAGNWTHSQIGGWADLRNSYGASQAQSPFSVIKASQPASAFDEYFHTADFRAGSGRSGWYNIANLGVFLWRLPSFGVNQTVPVSGSGAQSNCYTFDPTGRRIPLFAASTRPLGDTWVAPQEWQLPTPIRTPLLQACLDNPQPPPLYAQIGSDGVTLEPNSLGIFTLPGSFYELIDVSGITAFPEEPGTAHEIMVFPETGVFEVLDPPLNGPITVRYYYGFSAPMGAGPYDRRIIGQTPNPTPQPQINVAGGGPALSVLSSIPPTGTVSVNDSLTYNLPPDIPGVTQFTLIAQNPSRPVIRLTPSPPPDATEWVISGLANSSLVIEGILLSGGDLVLRGSFSTVTLTCCTLDPGNSTEPFPVSGGSPFAAAVDGRLLTPTRLWIEAEIQQLTIDRCILGPIRTRSGGQLENLTMTNSIVQAIPTTTSSLLTAADIKDPASLAARLQNAHDGLSSFLSAELSPATQALLAAYTGPATPSLALVEAIVSDLNNVISGPLIYQPAFFTLVNLTPAVMQQIAANPSGAALESLNRILLELAYPVDLADLTLGFDNGLADLSDSTLLGPAYVHQLEASECILDDVTIVENAQQGCVRFSAWSTGSVVPRQYQSVQIAPGSPLFVSRSFGQPGYAQLLDGVDDEIVSAAAGATISQGAQNGAEMGAFASQKNPIKERSILIKYQEYMPLGLNPVLIHVT
jgi:hypothetical protein